MRVGRGTREYVSGTKFSSVVDRMHTESLRWRVCGVQQRLERLYRSGSWSAIGVNMLLPMAS